MVSKNNLFLGSCTIKLIRVHVQYNYIPEAIPHTAVHFKYIPLYMTTRISLQTSPGSYGLLLNNWERAHGTYPVTMAMLHLLLNTLKSCDPHVRPEGVVASAVYIMQAVFVSSHNWRYQNQLQRDKFCKDLIVSCHVVRTSDSF